MTTTRLGDMNFTLDSCDIIYGGKLHRHGVKRILVARGSLRKEEEGRETRRESSVCYVRYEGMD